MSVLLVIAILVLLIIVHELGHFVAAKLSGVKVEEFGVGYPPRAFLFGTIRGTEYTLNWIPFGGFVRLFGDEGESQRGRGSFIDASRGKQAFILVAGVCMNLLAAWVIFTGALHMGIPRAVDTQGPGVQLIISDVVPGSPAEAGGLMPGDGLLALTDSSGGSPVGLSPQAISDYVNGRAGQKLTISYVRQHAISSTTLIPANAVIPGEAGRTALGIGLVLVSSEPLSWGDAAIGAFSAIWNAFTQVTQSLWTILTQALHADLNLSDVVGPVGLVGVVGEAAQTGFAQVMALAAFISVNLAVINLLPIPALDGGRLVIVAIEAIRRKPVSKLTIHILNSIGVIAIVLLMVVVTYHDIARLVT
jgi:regulator of sigma E protease